MDAFYGAVEGATYDDEQGGYKFPTGATLPDVAFAVGETLYTVSGKDLAFGEAGSGYTFGGLQSRGDLDFDIFGDVFLKAVYVVCKCFRIVYVRRLLMRGNSQPGREDRRACPARRLSLMSTAERTWTLLRLVIFVNIDSPKPV